DGIRDRNVTGVQTCALPIFLYGTATAVVVVLIGSLFGLIPVPTMEETLSVKYHMAYMIILPGVIALLGWNKAVQILTPINAILFIKIGRASCREDDK